MTEVHVLETWAPKTEAHKFLGGGLVKPNAFHSIQSSPVYSGMGPVILLPPHSSSPLIGHEGHSGRERNLTAQRVAPRAPSSSRPVSVALGSCACRGHSRALLSFRSSRQQNPGRSVSIRPAEHLTPGGWVGWQRGQSSGAWHTELEGQPLAVLGSYKNGKSRFLTM